MVLKFFPNIKKPEKGLPACAGITLVEIVVVIFIIAIFLSIIIAGFPRILRSLALSRATYKLEQDIRRTEDLGLSGVQSADSNGQQILVKGYGIYVSLNSSPAEEYVIYADVPGSALPSGARVSPKRYVAAAPTLCSAVNQQRDGTRTSDCFVEPPVNVASEENSLFISGVTVIDNKGYSSPLGSNSGISIDFAPPNPTITIEDQAGNFYSAAGITLKNSDGLTRTVWINGAGLINVQ